MERKRLFAIAGLVAMLGVFATASAKDYDIRFKYNAFNLCKYNDKKSSYLTKCTGNRPVTNEVGYNFVAMMHYTPVDSSFLFVEGTATWKSKMTSWRMDTNSNGDAISVIDFVYFESAEAAPVETKLVLAETYANVIRIKKSASYFTGKIDYVTDTRDKPTWSSGSAVAISDSILVTNSHVIDGVADFKLWRDGERVETPLGFDIISGTNDGALDLAIIKVRDGGLRSCAISETAPVLGETVHVWGYPNTRYQGIDIKVTRGIVSGKRGFMGDERMFQIDAAVQPGNSGGPVVQNGKVIGIATAFLIDSDNVAFAINAENIRGMLNKYGVVPKPTTNNFEECTYMIHGNDDPGGESHDNVHGSRKH